MFCRLFTANPYPKVVCLKCAIPSLGSRLLVLSFSLGVPVFAVILEGLHHQHCTILQALYMMWRGSLHAALVALVARGDNWIKCMSLQEFIKYNLS